MIAAQAPRAGRGAAAALLVSHGRVPVTQAANY